MPPSETHAFIKTARQQQRLQERLTALFAFDTDIVRSLNLPPETLLIGVDEVGRGSLIGPVLAAAACFNVNTPPQNDNLERLERLLGLDDSKASHLHHAFRTQLALAIRQHATTATAEATQAEVEALNVSQASLLAAKRAVLSCLEQCSPKAETPVLILLDGRHTISGLEQAISETGIASPVKQLAIVKGDGKAACIAAASILAKTQRDDWVQQLAKAHPEWATYDWASNMGYATPVHRSAIEAHGFTPHHRKTFHLKHQRTQSAPCMLACDER